MKSGYSLLYVDPPWQQTKGGKRACRPKQGKQLDYSTLSGKEIRKIIDDVPKHDTHVLFVWTVDKFLHECEELFTDYKLHARLIWDKTNGVAPAFTVRYAHEYLLWFYRPKLLPIAKNMRGRYTTVLRERATKHSRKPLVARQMLENLYPHEKRIEMFARENFKGWDAHGDECPAVEQPNTEEIKR